MNDSVDWCLVCDDCGMGIDVRDVDVTELLGVRV